MDLDQFRRQVREWLSANLELKAGLPKPTDAEDRVLQAKIADGGYAGLPYPVEYGGRGLTRATRRSFTRRRLLIGCRRA